MAASKIYEAQAAINSKEVHTTLEELVFAKSPDLRNSLKQLNKAIGAADWLSRMRNGMGFHYPKFSDWEQYTTPDSNWVDDIVYVGEQSGNTFYDSSASIAMHWMFDKYRNFEAVKSVDPLMNEMIDLIRQMNDFANAMAGQIIMKLVPNGSPKFVGKVIAPEHRKVPLPYWTHF
jgi:hypothetical protein